MATSHKPPAQRSGRGGGPSGLRPAAALHGVARWARLDEEARADLAEVLGRECDEVFLQECRRLSLNPVRAIESPLAAVALRREGWREIN